MEKRRVFKTHLFKNLWSTPYKILGIAFYFIKMKILGTVLREGKCREAQ